jgi:hypothetical protein
MDGMFAFFSSCKKKIPKKKLGFFFAPFFTMMEIDPFFSEHAGNEQDLLDCLKDPIFISVCDLVCYLRNHNSEPLELEIRVGLFGQDNTFNPGYSHVALMKRMMLRLQNNCAKLKNWTKLDDFKFLTSEFPNNLRKRTCPQTTPILIEKKKLAKLDLSSNRIMGLRVCLSNEIPVTDSKRITECEKIEPLSMRIVHRASFVEKVCFDNFSVSFQYDISKVSSAARNKIECTKTPASYQCEIEIKDKLIKLGNEQEELRQNRLIAFTFLNNAKTFLGTHKLVSNDVSERLCQPSLAIISQTIPK